MHHIVQWVYKAMLNCLYLCCAHKLKWTNLRGRGVIFTLHQVNDLPQSGFAPNSILTIKPGFLEQTIEKLLNEGYDIISLDDATQRLKNSNNTSRFAVFTFDDGYRDNFQNAYPIFKKYNLPFTIFITSDFSSHKGEIWWVALEEIIAKEESIDDPFIQNKKHPLITNQQKNTVFENIYCKLRKTDQNNQRKVIKQLADKYHYDLHDLSKRLIMDWDELRELNKDPLVSLEAHTKSHFALGRLSEDEAKSDILNGIEKMQQELGEQPKHFAYPYGDKDSAGEREFKLLHEHDFQSAVTTRKGLIYQEHNTHLTALPRVSLNGNYQKIRYIEMFLTGIPFYLHNRMQRLNVH